MVNCIRILRKSIILFSLILVNTTSQAQYFKTRFSFDGVTNLLSFYIKPTIGPITTDISSFQFDVTYPLASNITFGAITNNTSNFPGLNVIAANLFTLNGEWVKRWEHQGTISNQTYNLNTEYLLFSVAVAGSGTLGLNYKSDYPNFDPVFTVNSVNGDPLWDDIVPHDVYYPTQLQSGNIVYMTLDVTLPVELSNFGTQVKNKSVILNWTTLSEQNLEGFEVERSLDNKEYKTLIFKKAKGGIFQANYTFEDQNTMPGTNYFYRLKILDNNGAYKYSDIEYIHIPSASKYLEIVSNPTNKTIQIVVQSNENELLSIELFNMQGVLVQRKQINILEGNSIWSIETEGMQSGTYIIRITASDLLVSQKVNVLE